MTEISGVFLHRSSKTTQNNFWRTMAPPKYRISGCMLSLRPNCRHFDEDAVLRYREMKSCCSQARGQKARNVRRYFSCIFERLTQVRKLRRNNAKPEYRRSGRRTATAAAARAFPDGFLFDWTRHCHHKETFVPERPELSDGPAGSSHAVIASFSHAGRTST